MTLKIWAAEFTGTFAIIFLGCGSLVLTEQGSLNGAWAPWVFGLTVAAMITCFARFGGAHFNPAVTAAFHSLGQRQAPLWIYWTAQLAGAAMGCFILSLCLGGQHSYGASLPRSSIWITFGLEALGTFIIVFVILKVRLVPPLAIGLAVAVVSWLIGPISGGAFNPARSLMPTLWAGGDAGLLLYPTAAFAGGLLAALAIRILRLNRSP